MSNSAYSLEYITSKKQYEVKRITAKRSIDISKVSNEIRQLSPNLWVCSDKNSLIDYVPVIKQSMIQDLEKKAKMITDRKVVVM